MENEKVSKVAETQQLNIFDVSDSVIQKFLSTKKYKRSFVNIVLKKEKYKTLQTSIGSDELLKDFVEYLKHYH